MGRAAAGLRRFFCLRQNLYWDRWETHLISNNADPTSRMENITVTVRVDPLFEPFNLAGLKLRNRFVMSPMTRNFSPGGIPGDNVAAYYRRRAKDRKSTRLNSSH